jgi:hypothetical protein
MRYANNIYCTVFTGGNSVPSAVEVRMVDFKEAINSLPSITREDLLSAGPR